MPEDQLISRRGFVWSLGASAAGLLSAGGVVACAGDRPTEAEPRRDGQIVGRVLNAAGNPQPLVGSVTLLRASGQQSGYGRAVDPFGGFDFESVPPGDWQLRFHAPGLAYVPSQYENPRRITVHEGQRLQVDLITERAVEVDDAMIEIYAGDYFFQEQPQGKENSETVVPLGTAICWYNVGLMPHIISGSWGDSPVLDRGGNYIWTPTKAGLYTYRCSYHPTQMIAALRVVED